MTSSTLAKKNPLDILNRTFLLDYPREAARSIELMPPKDAIAVLKEHPAYILQPVWTHLAPGAMDMLLLRLPDTTVKNLLMAMDAGSCAMLLSRVSEEQREHFLSLLDESVRKEVKDLLAYPDNSAATLMSTHVVAFNENITVEDAITQLKNQNAKAFHYLFLLGDNMKLQSKIDMQKLVTADRNQKLSSLSEPIQYYTAILDSKNDVIEKFQKYNINTLPVVDGRGLLVGIIYGKNLIRELREDISADMQTMVGVSKDEHALSSPWFAVRKRLPWLQINLITAFLAAAVVGVFEETIAQYTALAVLLPIAASQSGNTGAQALAVTMRGLTLREITVREWVGVVVKEAGAAFINSIAIAITCCVGVYIWSQNIGLALIIALAMIISMIIAAISGALVPIILKRFGQDPALSSSIILTTITDIAGFMSFLGIAKSFAHMLEVG